MFFSTLRAKVVFFFDIRKNYANFVKNTWQKRQAYLIAPSFCIPLVYLWYRKSDLQIRRPEGVRRNALRVLRPNYPHSEEIAQYIEQKTRRSIGHLWAFGGKNWRAVLSHTTWLPSDVHGWLFAKSLFSLFTFLFPEGILPPCRTLH